MGTQGLILHGGPGPLGQSVGAKPVHGGPGTEGTANYHVAQLGQKLRGHCSPEKPGGSGQAGPLLTWPCRPVRPTLGWLVGSSCTQLALLPISHEFPEKYFFCFFEKGRPELTAILPITEV